MPGQEQSSTALHLASSQTAIEAAQRILIVVDSASAAAAIARWLSAARRNIIVANVVVLSVMPPPETTRTRGIFADSVRRHLREAGHVQLAPLQAALDELGARHEERVELIEDAGTIERIAREMRCGLIVMAAAEPSTTRKLWLSATGLGMPSLAGRVAETAGLPTLVVKHRSH